VAAGHGAHFEAPARRLHSGGPPHHSGPHRKEAQLREKLLPTGIVVGSIVFADIMTKRWALESLYHGMPTDTLGGLVPLTLAFNKGIAFGLPLPSAGRWIIIIATVVVLSVLADLFRRADPRDWSRLLAIQLVTAGALGNLIDRVRWDGGVVDFIGPINLGFMYWPIFNVADMAITTGAVLLGLSLWREEAAGAATEPVRAVEDTAS
jgi:signal peptidase II